MTGGSEGTLLRKSGLSVVFMAMTFVTFAAYAVAAGALRDRVLTRPRLVTRIRARSSPPRSWP